MGEAPVSNSLSHTQQFFCTQGANSPQTSNTNPDTTICHDVSDIVHREKRGRGGWEGGVISTAAS